MKRWRVVIDTNVYVSRFLCPDSTPGRAVAKAWADNSPLTSVATWTELRAVLSRAKFDRYIKSGTLEPFLRSVWSVSAPIVVPTPIRACRDPRDDKFLEVAVFGVANVIITGDQDLLDLNPFRGIQILSPAQYLEHE